MLTVGQRRKLVENRERKIREKWGQSPSVPEDVRFQSGFFVLGRAYADPDIWFTKYEIADHLELSLDEVNELLKYLDLEHDEPWTLRKKNPSPKAKNGMYAILVDVDKDHDIIRWNIEYIMRDLKSLI